MSRRTRPEKRKGFYKTFDVAPVPEQLYPHSDEVEREEIAQRLAVAKSRKEKADGYADRLLLRPVEATSPMERLAARLGLAIAGNPRTPTKVQAHAARVRARASRIPVSLLACPDCNFPTPKCTCVNAAGEPLDWRSAAMG